MKQLILLILLLASQFANSQENPQGLKIIDLSQIQIRLLNKCKDMDTAKRSEIFADSIYRPHKQFWSGYVGSEKKFLSWMNIDAMTFLNFLNHRNADVDGAKLLEQFNEVKHKMQTLTGYSAIGTWYIVYSHGMTNLGGLTTGEMLIDLSHESNNSNENIISFFPHEITHQIMNNVNQNKDTTAIGAIIGEGFAVYMNQLYWGKKYSLAQNLGFTEEELKQCKKEKKLIHQFFKENKFSGDRKTIEKFRARYYKLNSQLPGAIGYYIGYKIIEKYVKKAGKDSWRDVFTKPPRSIYELSGY